MLCIASLTGCAPNPPPDHLIVSAAEDSPRPRTLPPAPAEPDDVPPFSPNPTLREPVLQFDSLNERYYASSDAATKVELIGEVANLENGEAVNGLSHLFQSERDTELKLALLAAVMVREESAAKQLTVYAGGLWPLQPQSVRLMAIEGLAVLRTPEAIAMLRGLQFDADGEIRAAAADALER